MAPKNLPSSARERSAAQLERDGERARLAALAEAEDPGEPEAPAIPQESQEEGEQSEESPEEAEPEISEAELEAEPEPPKKKKPSVWEAMRAVEERQQAALADKERRDQERMEALMARIEDRLRPRDPEPEIDPEVDAWNSAVRETITPELQALRVQNFLDKLEFSQRLAALRHTDYEALVGDIHDPHSEMARYLNSNPSERDQVFKAKDIGEALYQKARFIKESTPEAREAWRETERKRIYDETKAELLKEFKQVMTKGQKAPPKPDSMLSMVNGSGAPTNAPLTPDQIRNMSKRDLQALVARGEAGEEI